MTKHPLRATFEHFDEPMSADFRLTLRARLLTDLASVDDSALPHPQLDDTTTDVDETQEVIVLKKIDRSRRPHSRTKLLVGIAAVTVIAVGVGALVVNMRSADELVATDDSSVSVSPAASANENGSLEGLWTTGPVPIDQITSAMLGNGLTQEVVDAWIAEVGAPNEYTFDLKFQGDDFSHYEQSPGVQRQVDETGTFVFTEGKLELVIDDQGDTYTFSTIMVCCDSLQLRPARSPANGAAQDDAELARLIASYTSAPFQRRVFP